MNNTDASNAVRFSIEYYRVQCRISYELESINDYYTKIHRVLMFPYSTPMFVHNIPYLIRFLVDSSYV